MLQVKRHLGQFQYFYWDFRAKDLPVCYSLKERYKLNQGIDSFLQASAYTGTLHGYFHFYIGLVVLMTPCVSRHHNTQSRDDLLARFMRGLPFRAGWVLHLGFWFPRAACCWSQHLEFCQYMWWVDIWATLAVPKLKMILPWGYCSSPWTLHAGLLFSANRQDSRELTWCHKCGQDAVWSLLQYWPRITMVVSCSFIQAG